MTDEQDASDLAMQLRDWLHARAQHAPNDLLAAVLTYELAALVARHVSTQAEACELIDRTVVEMKNQIREFGVGVEHP